MPTALRGLKITVCTCFQSWDFCLPVRRAAAFHHAHIPRPHLLPRWVAPGPAQARTRARWVCFLGLFQAQGGEESCDSLRREFTAGRQLLLLGVSRSQGRSYSYREGGQILSHRGTQLVHPKALGAAVPWGSLRAGQWSNLLCDLEQATSPLWSSGTSLCCGYWTSVIDTLSSHAQNVEGSQCILSVCVLGSRGQCEQQPWLLGPHGLSSCGMTGRTCQEGCDLATLLPSSLPWFTQTDFNPERQVPVTCLEAAPPSGQTGLSLTPQLPGMWLCQEETCRLSVGWHFGQSPSSGWQHLVSTDLPITPKRPWS